MSEKHTYDRVTITKKLDDQFSKGMLGFMKVTIMTESGLINVLDLFEGSDYCYQDWLEDFRTEKLLETMQDSIVDRSEASKYPGYYANLQLAVSAACYADYTFKFRVIEPNPSKDLDDLFDEVLETLYDDRRSKNKEIAKLKKTIEDLEIIVKDIPEDISHCMKISDEKSKLMKSYVDHLRSDADTIHELKGYVKKLCSEINKMKEDKDPNIGDIVTLRCMLEDSYNKNAELEKEIKALKARKK